MSLKMSTKQPSIFLAMTSNGCQITHIIYSIKKKKKYTYNII